MAETKDVVFKVKIDGQERVITNLKELKQAKKDATDAFIKGDKDAARSLAELKDKTEDLADATRSLKTDGVEPLTGSFGLLTEGLGSGDIDKIKVGFKGLGAAMSALPIFILIEGFKYLLDHVKDIVEFFGKAKTKSDLLTDALTQQKKANDVLAASLTNEIKLLEAQGGHETKILALKKELIALKLKEAEADILIQKQKIKEILTNDSLTESLQKQAAAYYRLQGNNTAADLIDRQIAADKKSRIKEVSDKIREDVVAIQNLRTEDKINEIKNNKDREAAYKKHLENLAAIKLQNESDQRALDEQNKKIQTQNEDDLQKQLVGKKVADKEVELGALQGVQNIYDQLDKETKAKSDQDDVDNASEKAKAVLSIATEAIQAEQNLSDLFFNWKLGKVKKDSAEGEALARKQFNLNKAFQIGLTVTQGIQNGITAYGAGLKAASATGAGAAIAPAIGAAYAAISAIGTIAAVAKIASTQFQASGTGSLTSGGGGQSNIPLPPTTQAPTTQTQPITTFTGNNNDNFNHPIKAVVVETDMTNSQNRVNKLTRQSQFG